MHGTYRRSCDEHYGTLGYLAPDDMLDTIVYIDALEQVAEDRPHLEHAARRLNDVGRVVVLSPAHQWLFSLFGAAARRVRRYNGASTLKAKPDAQVAVCLCYVGSVGLLASAGNRLLLAASRASISQFRLGGGVIVRASRRVDPLARFHYSKSIVASYRKQVRP